jgi:hypothetical protein
MIQIGQIDYLFNLGFRLGFDRPERAQLIDPENTTRLAAGVRSGAASRRLRDGMALRQFIEHIA